MAHGDHPEIPGGSAGTAGTRSEAAGCGLGSGRTAADLGACGERGRGAGRDAAGEGAGCGAAGVFCGDFDHHAHRAGAGAGALRSESGVLLPARPAVGGARVSERAEAAHAGAGGDGVLAESAERMLSPRNSRGGGERADLRSLVATLQHAAAVVEAAAGAAELGAGAEPDRCRASDRAGLRGGAGYEWRGI